MVIPMTMEDKASSIHNSVPLNEYSEVAEPPILFR